MAGPAAVARSALYHPAEHAGHHLPRVDIEQTPRGSGTNITFKALATLTSAAGDASDPARARPPRGNFAARRRRCTGGLARRAACGATADGQGPFESLTRPNATRRSNATAAEACRQRDLLRRRRVTTAAATPPRGGCALICSVLDPNGPSSVSTRERWVDTGPLHQRSKPGRVWLLSLVAHIAAIDTRGRSPG